MAKCRGNPHPEKQQNKNNYARLQHGEGDLFNTRYLTPFPFVCSNKINDVTKAIDIRFFPLPPPPPLFSAYILMVGPQQGKVSIEKS